MQQRLACKENRAAEEPKRRAKSSQREERLRKDLKEVHVLLESYAPIWYTETLSKRINAALR